MSFDSSAVGTLLDLIPNPPCSFRSSGNGVLLKEGALSRTPDFSTSSHDGAGVDNPDDPSEGEF
jgi:hypothetical protein